MRLALFSLTVAGALIAGAMPGIAADYGLPSDVAQSARSRCAKSFESLSSQDTCMRNEAQAYGRLYDIESDGYGPLQHLR